MKTSTWLVQATFYGLLTMSLGCSDTRNPGDAAAGPDVPLPGDGGGIDRSLNVEAGIVDGSFDDGDGRAPVCWYEKGANLLLPSFDFTLVAPDRTVYTCSSGSITDAGPPWPRDLRGVVTSVTATQFTLDTCVDEDACDSGVYTFKVDIPGLALTVPVGRRVRVQWRIGTFWGCHSWLQVSDDTADSSGTVWLVGNHGFQIPPYELPFALSLEQLGCRLPADAEQRSCSRERTGDYAFRFTSKVDPASTLALGTGESGRFTFHDAEGAEKILDVHCLKAFQTVFCDDYWRWDFWAVSPQVADEPLDAAVD